MVAGGHLTVEFGRYLADLLKRRGLGLEVLYDHERQDEGGGNLVAWYGSEQDSPSHLNQLSQLDIAVVDPGTRRAYALIEIEETSDRPKTILGDIFSILLSDHVSFKGEELQIGPWTSLIVVGKRTGATGRRDDIIAENAMLARGSFKTANASIGTMYVVSVRDQDELKRQLLPLVERALFPAIAQVQLLEQVASAAPFIAFRLRWLTRT